MTTNGYSRRTATGMGPFALLCAAWNDDLTQAAKKWCLLCWCDQQAAKSLSLARFNPLLRQPRSMHGCLALATYKSFTTWKQTFT
ncbi:hypothetical protein V2G26_011537 [Clonostachys chloroleuca]